MDLILAALTAALLLSVADYWYDFGILRILWAVLTAATALSLLDTGYDAGRLVVTACAAGFLGASTVQVLETMTTRVHMASRSGRAR